MAKADFNRKQIGNISIENASIGFRNFSGKEGSITPRVIETSAYFSKQILRMRWRLMDGMFVG